MLLHQHSALGTNTHASVFYSISHLTRRQSAPTCLWVCLLKTIGEHQHLKHIDYPKILINTVRVLFQLRQIRPSRNSWTRGTPPSSTHPPWSPTWLNQCRGCSSTPCCSGSWSLSPMLTARSTTTSLVQKEMHIHLHSRTSSHILLKIHTYTHTCHFCVTLLCWHA